MKKGLTIVGKVIGFVLLGALGIIILIQTSKPQESKPVVTRLVFENAQGDRTFISKERHPKLFRDMMLLKENEPKKYNTLLKQAKTADCPAQLSALIYAQIKKQPLGGKYFWFGITCNSPEDIDKAEALYRGNLLKEN
jgi:hypothetical protein